MPSAETDDRLILQTQIARTYGLRGDFATAETLLAEVEPALATASAEARVRYWLELGRVHGSPAHSEIAPDAHTQARDHYLQAYELAQAAELDGLAVDALHMLAIIVPDSAEQLLWNQRALTYLHASNQPAAKRWEGSLHHNIGYLYHMQGQYDDALAEFALSRAAYERDGRSAEIRVADWMIAWTLRAQERLDEALAIQLRLEQECDAAGQPDPFVFEELATLYSALGNDALADAYATKQKALS